MPKEIQIVPGEVCGGHSYLIGPVAFSPDGDRFVSGDLNGRLIVWSRTARQIASVRVPPAGAAS